MKVIGIVGSRRRDTGPDFQKVKATFFHECYSQGDEIVSGGCSAGADRFAEQLAKQYQIPIKIYYAEWNRLGKGAGFARNGLIARDADILIACVAPDRTGGTEDTIRKFEKLGKGKALLV